MHTFICFCIEIKELRIRQEEKSGISVMCL
jgi:hypothetical protein